MTQLSKFILKIMFWVNFVTVVTVIFIALQFMAFNPLHTIYAQYLVVINGFLLAALFCFWLIDIFERITKRE